MGKKGIVDVSASDISEPLPASQAGGATSARIFPGNGDSAVAETLELGSTFALLRRSARDFPDRSCFGWREQPGEGSFKFLTYADVLSKVTKLGTALISHFSLPVGTKVGIYGKNCPAWSMTQYAVNAAGMVIVPIYDTLGVDIVEYVCNHSEAKIVFIASENYEKWKAAQPRCSTVEHVVLFDVGPLEDSAEVKKIKKDDSVLSLWDVLEKGTDIMDSLPSPNVDDLNVIMYTSGTTGKPKGVMLLNRNLLASVGSAYFFFSKWDQDFVETDVYLSYLPLSHIFEQQAQALFIGKGAKIGFYSGNIKLLLSDMEELCPTVFAGVPRVFARFQQRIEENVEKSSFVKRLLFKWAYDRQLEAVQNPTQVSRSPLWDSLVMNKVREKLLPRCRLVITGSAPMSAQTNDFLKICLNCPVVQGYGLTETVGGMNCSAPGVSTSGTCGGPLPGSIVKLADLPEMGYLSSNKPHPQGEVCVKGDVVFSGYFKNQEATDAAFDADGYFHTGDVGRWNLDGTLQIIDRAKNLFKLSQGEYVSPENLEQEYAKAKLVLQIFVYGNSLQSTLLAVVVPDSDAAKVWGKENINSDDVLQIASSPEFKKEVLAQLLEMHGKAKFKSYEKIVDVIIEANDLNELGQGFTVDNNLMTPSFKLKRPQLNQKYKARLDEIYNAKK